MGWARVKRYECAKDGSIVIEDGRIVGHSDDQDHIYSGNGWLVVETFQGSRKLAVLHCFAAESSAISECERWNDDRAREIHEDNLDWREVRWRL